MRKPSHVVYGVEERPPAGVAILSGLQHVALMSMFLLYPVLIAKEAGAPAQVALAMVSLTLVALAIGTMLQVIPMGPIGSGYLCQPIPSIVYLVPSVIVAREAGLAVVFGLTVAAGLFELVLSRALRRLRPIFPPEIVGLVILLVGIATGLLGIKVAFGTSAGGIQPAEMIVGLGTLGLMVALNVWGGWWLRIFCVLIGMAVGYVVHVAWIGVPDADFQAMNGAALVAFPSFSHVGWSFDPHYIVPFAVAAVAAALKVIGNVTTSEKANDADWVRVDMNKVSRGVVADGLGTVVAGALGTQGLNSSPTVVGLATATGVLSRAIAYPVAALLLVLAFLPKVGALFYLTPRPVVAAALVFSSTFIIVNGLQVMTSRLLDARKTLLIGLALLAGIAVDAQPAVLQVFPEAWKPVLGTSLVIGTILGLALNLAFRMGVRTTQSMTVPIGPIDAEGIAEFLQSSGEKWGARPDVIGHAKFNLAQSIETIMEGCSPEGPLEVDATFDEFRLDIRVSYVGPLLELPERRPTNEEIMESEEGQRRLAGFMLRRMADRVSASYRSGRSTITFHFDH